MDLKTIIFLMLTKNTEQSWQNTPILKLIATEQKMQHEKH